MTTFVVALVSAAALVGAVTAVLPRLGFMDVPNHRSSHAQPVPRGGGIPLVPCLFLALSASSTWTAELVWLVAGATALGVVGLIDDARDVAAPVRLGLQVVLTMTIGIGLLSTATTWPPLLLLATGLGAALWLTGFVNVYNFMDGANGVAGFQAAVAGGWFAYVGAREDTAPLVVGGLALLGASLGFLPWNYPRARVFLGDVGSYSIGLVIGSLGLLTLLSTRSLVLAIAPLCVFIADTALTLASRARAGKPVMTAHREHVYQRVAVVPGSLWPAVATSGAAVACVLVAGVATIPVTLVCWVCVIGAYVSLPKALEGRNKRSLR